MTITWEIVTMFLVAGGAVAGGFWRIWGLIDAAKKDALLRADAAIALAGVAREELSSHKLHVAESYVTKAGMNEQTDRIMRSLEGVAEKIDRTNERLDSLMLAKAPARSRSST